VQRHLASQLADEDRVQWQAASPRQETLYRDGAQIA